MAYRTIEELPVWNAALELAVGVFDLTNRGGLGPHAGLRDQLERAAVSISNNIAEGYERGSTAELLTFLYYARGSAGEVRSMLAILERGTEWSAIREEVERLRQRALSISRQLGAWIEAVKNSDWKGNRFENEATRDRRTRDARRIEFLAQLNELQEAARRSWESQLRSSSDCPPDPDSQSDPNR
ncbi:four helix bundle protein [Tautonia sociabilis]|uniref:Four helix bundle protein n=1 Tax=Tautonia sociabilis TaxID=2080755 RepID=A0A432MRS6_9BACT|nr:four helix bundle protein [Tautonia sociabilis]RUL89666.1 four helix bundle protein [Tautonia sociabilis]